MGRRRVTSVASLDDGTLVAVFQYGGLSPSILVGAPGEPMRDVRVTGTSVARDGGTTTHRTAEGDLFLPRDIHGPTGTATWNGRPLTRLDPSELDIDLSGVPTITPRPLPSP